MEFLPITRTVFQVHEIGAGVFGVLSLLNHSCDPNVVRHYYSCNAAVRAIRTIRKVNNR